MVAPMPRPISAARLANSDRLGLPSPSPAAAFCSSVRRDRRCEPTLAEAWRRLAVARMAWNSPVRFWMEWTAISAGQGLRLLSEERAGRWLGGSDRVCAPRLGGCATGCAFGMMG